MDFGEKTRCEMHEFFNSMKDFPFLRYVLSSRVSRGHKQILYKEADFSAQREVDQEQEQSWIYRETLRVKKSPVLYILLSQLEFLPEVEELLWTTIILSFLK